MTNSNLIYDSHCHLSALVGISPESFRVAIPAILPADIHELDHYRKNINPQAKIGIGLHPWYIDKNVNLAGLTYQMEDFIDKYHPDFIGETGLDKNKPYFELQQEIFVLHLKLAKKYDLPVIIHCVRAYNELLEKLKTTQNIRGVVHAYNANSHIASQLANHNMLLGVGSIILNATSQLAKSVAKFESSQILVESDAPYMPKQGEERSFSSNCSEYVAVLADYRQEKLAKMIDVVNQNWLRLFG